jgi:hypothetical protein
MVPALRKAFNEQFSEEKYQSFLEELNKGWLHPAQFRVAETPVFLPDDLVQKLIAAGDDILETILRPDFKALTERAIPDKWRVANENEHSHMLAFDFGVTKDEAGNLIPKLIEIQGFPSLFAFQSHLGAMYQQRYDLPKGQDIYFNGLNQKSYIELLRRTVLGDHKPEEVVLMDVDAPDQKTAIDFFVTNKYLGIAVVSLSDLIQEGRKLYYKAGDNKVEIKRVYNRLIFDELEGKPDIFNEVVDVRQDLDVEWLPHPNWFYRISKFTMPYLHSDFVPKTYFLHELKSIPEDLSKYVLKPLFSFAGQGVIIDVTKDDIAAIKDPENWVLQEKVEYEPVVQSPDGGVKCEIRLLYLWPDGDERPTLAINLMRLSRGKMIGVRYNKNFNWVGGTIGFFKDPSQSK